MALGRLDMFCYKATLKRLTEGELLETNQKSAKGDSQENCKRSLKSELYNYSGVTTPKQMKK